MCRDDIFFFIRVFVWQFNPRRPGREVEPFVDWDFQGPLVRKILDSVECHCHQDPAVHQHDLVIEKSREMGATWVCLIVALWLALFHPNKQVLMISRNEKAVFGEDPDSLFWKLDFMLRHLPAWLTGGNASVHGKAREARGHGIQRLKRSFTFPNGSSITGEASTGKAGVGGRATLMFIDEFSQIDEAEEVLGRTSDTTGCRIFNGTHLGTGTAFFKLTRREDMPKLVLHWTQHPQKRKGLYHTVDRKVVYDDRVCKHQEDYPFVLDGGPTGGPYPGLRSPWYDWQCSRKMDARKVAMDLDIDPMGSKHQFFDPIRVQSQRRGDSSPPYWVGRLQHDPATAMPELLVKDPGGKLKLWVIPDLHGRVPVGKYAMGVDVSAGTGATPSCLALMNDRGEQVLEYASAVDGPDELAILGVALCRHFADWDGSGARLGWEVNGPGARFGKRILELGYRNLLYHDKSLSAIPKPTDKPGFFPSPDAKRAILEEFRSAWFGGRLLIRSDEVMAEALNFVYTDIGKVDHDRLVLEDDPAGSRENHGDRIIAAAIMWLTGKSRVFRPPEEKDSDGPRPCTLAWRRQMAQNVRREQEAWA